MNLAKEKTLWNGFKPFKVPVKPHLYFRIRKAVSKDMARNKELYSACALIATFLFFMTKIILGAI